MTVEMSKQLSDAYGTAKKMREVEKGNPRIAALSPKDRVKTLLRKKGERGQPKPVDTATKQKNERAVADLLESKGLMGLKPIPAKPKSRDIKSTFGDKPKVDEPEDGNPLPAPNIAAAADTSAAELSTISAINRLGQSDKKRPQYAALSPTKRQQKRTARIERQYQKQSQKNPEKALKRYQKRTARAEFKTAREDARRRARAKSETGGPKEDLMEISGQLNKASKLHGNQSKRVAGVAKGMKGEAGNPYMKRSKSKYGM